ncbi:hypothetical protein HXX76_009972 [Chlamydomonas incerta]|uniref:Adaptor protein ClpS core domain-containing protein n=1 Tax=Chlamydomonas incerta TaxID=51695 RepID=A0A835SNT9_CHLIN|nr:hypothetical protein HXX76_009972 [Chlamydomonas incerta]|eukprot:KAG2430449.1 hypothetical protein HXX76_009972 [Chlamydomonas incerta]
MLATRCNTPRSRSFAAQARQVRVRALRVEGRFGGGGRGGNVIDRPDVDVSKRLGGFDLSDWNIPSWDAKTDNGNNGSTDQEKKSPPGGGNYRVLLLDSPQHTEKAVVAAITHVVPGTSPDHARNCFATSKQLGMAIITTALKEHAEMYREQLYTYRVRTALEPDNSTV